MKKIEIYKKDKWNMIHAEIQGRTIVVREISDQWGEDTHVFQGRPEMLHWAEQRFSQDRFDGSEEERQHILAAFKDV